MKVGNTAHSWSDGLRPASLKLKRLPSTVPPPGARCKIQAGLTGRPGIWTGPKALPGVLQGQGGATIIGIAPPGTCLGEGRTRVCPLAAVIGEIPGRHQSVRGGPP